MTMILSGTNGGTFPSWTTATRPASPAVGQMGYNTTIGQFDCYTSGGWVTVLNSGSPQSQLPANIAGNGPLFSAYANVGITLTNATATQIPLQAELYDTASCFNNTASTVGGIPAYSFLPNVAGYYMVFGAVYFVNTSGAGAALFSTLYKNGSEFHRFGQVGSSTTNSLMASGGGIVYMNGTTDYVSLYGFQNSGSSLGTNAGQGVTYLQASLVRAA